MTVHFAAKCVSELHQPDIERLRTGFVAQSVKESIREDIDAIYELVEALALFDMLMSFATLASISKNFSRPIFESVCCVRHFESCMIGLRQQHLCSRRPCACCAGRMLVRACLSRPALPWC